MVQRERGQKQGFKTRIDYNRTAGEQGTKAFKVSIAQKAQAVSFLLTTYILSYINVTIV